MRTYTIRRVTGTPDWNTIPVLFVDQHLWLESDHIHTAAQICYDDEALYVKMQSYEKNIRAEHSSPLGMVCEDSCMEFFFCPEPDDDRYINFEINPNCCTYIGVGSGRADNVRLAPTNEAELFDKKAVRSQDGWAVTYRIPVSFLRALFPGYELTPGKVIRANCYKCGDLTEKEHYLSWNPVTSKTPDFHRPCDFGAMLLEQSKEEN
jgi:hypothetical protein